MPAYDKDSDTYTRWSRSDSAYTVLEWYVFLKTTGSVRGLDILDMACGEGCVSRAMMELGAASVIGTDISAEMVAEARKQNASGGDGPHYDHLSYDVVDACDETYALDPRVDLVTAMYLFHYASSKANLFKMCRFIGRNLKAGGRFVTYTINPDFDFEKQNPDMEEMFGFRYTTISPPKYALIIKGFEAEIWQWSRAAHEEGLKEAGFKNIRWHPLELPLERQNLEPKVEWYLQNPSLIVLSAEK
jgi:SAM-dependent methyltransferase